MEPSKTITLTSDLYLLEDLKKAQRQDKSIDWDCICLKPYLKGPCTVEFKAAYECYIKNNFVKEKCYREIMKYQCCVNSENKLKLWQDEFLKIKMMLNRFCKKIKLK